MEVVGCKGHPTLRVLKTQTTVILGIGRSDIAALMSWSGRQQMVGSWDEAAVPDR
jgi:hypothetical protein